jgi:NADPH:quinone reductase-like Zn-dependent oxidoreductase
VLFVAGYEGSGVVVELGEKAKRYFDVGDWIYFLCDGAGDKGAFAQYCQVKW